MQQDQYWNREFSNYDFEAASSGSGPLREQYRAARKVVRSLHNRILGNRRGLNKATELLRDLQQNGASHNDAFQEVLNEPDDRGFPLLHNAVRVGAPFSVIKALCELGADCDERVNSRNGSQSLRELHGMTALELALRSGNKAHIRFLLDQTEEVPERSIALLLKHAKSTAPLDLVSELNFCGAVFVDPSAKSDAVNYAIQSRHWALLETYLSEILQDVSPRRAQSYLLEALAQGATREILLGFARKVQRSSDSSLLTADEIERNVFPLIPKASNEHATKYVRFIERLESIAGYVHEDFSAAIVNHRFAETSGTGLHYLVAYGNPIQNEYKRIAELGFDFDELHSHHSEVNYSAFEQVKDLKGISILEFALHLQRAEAAVSLLEAGANPNRPSAAGRYPLQVFLDYRVATIEPGKERRDLLDALMVAGLDVELIEFGQRYDVVKAALMIPDLDSFKKLQAIAHGIDYWPSVEVFHEGTSRLVQGPELCAEIEGLLKSNKLSTQDVREASFLLQRSKDPYLMYLYMLAAEEKFDVDGGHSRGVAFERLTRRVVESFSLHDLMQFFNTFENMMDLNDSMHGFHPYEAEFCTLLAHPREERELREDALSIHDELTRAITSIDRYLDQGVPLKAVTVEAFKGIGMLTHSFRRWLYDAVRYNTPSDLEKKSLIERFGFEKSPARETDSVLGEKGNKVADWYGPGYFFAPQGVHLISADPKRRLFSTGAQFREQNFMELRRAYLLVSDPEDGTLIIRNSSPSFGRYSLKRAAYYTSLGVGDELSPEDLLNIDDRFINERMTPFLSLSVNSAEQQETGRMLRLVERAHSVLSAYQAWKFDSRPETAWMSFADEPSSLVGGHLSPGFSAMVEFLESAWQHYEMFGEERSVPDLAFVMPEQPPILEYRGDEGGRPVSRLVLDERKIRELRTLADGYDQGKLSEDVWDFFQFGLRKCGDLVMLPRRGVKV